MGLLAPGSYQLWIRCCRSSPIPSCGISCSSIISEIALYHSLKDSFVVSFGEIYSVFAGKAKNKEIWDFWFVFCQRLPVTCKTRLSCGVSALFGENCFFVLFFSFFVLWKSNVARQYCCEFLANNHILARTALVIGIPSSVPSDSLWQRLLPWTPTFLALYKCLWQNLFCTTRVLSPTIIDLVSVVIIVIVLITVIEILISVVFLYWDLIRIFVLRFDFNCVFVLRFWFVFLCFDLILIVFLSPVDKRPRSADRLQRSKSREKATSAAGVDGKVWIKPKKLDVSGKIEASNGGEQQKSPRPTSLSMTNGVDFSKQPPPPLPSGPVATTKIRSPEEVTGVKSPSPESWTVPIDTNANLNWINGQVPHTARVVQWGPRAQLLGPLWPSY